MLHFHDGSIYRMRALMTESRMTDAFSGDHEVDTFYCLDAVQDSPAGATWRVEPDASEPFAAPRLTAGRGIYY